MARWSALPRCSCLFSTAHPCNEIASLEQFALAQHSGIACRCPSCAGKRWENDLVPALKLSFRYVLSNCIFRMGSSSLTSTCVTLHSSMMQVTGVSSAAVFDARVGVLVSVGITVFTWSHSLSCPLPLFTLCTSAFYKKVFTDIVKKFTSSSPFCCYIGAFCHIFDLPWCVSLFALWPWKKKIK